MRLNFMAFGDTHGLEDIAYAIAKEWEKKNKKKVHAISFPGDLDTKVPEEGPDAIRSMIADYRYGSKKAPYMTFFVAGNMDEWSILRGFPCGGFIEKKKDKQKMYFLGRSGYADFMGIRIAGLSGVYDKRDYGKPLPTEPSFLPWQHYRRNEVENLIAWNPHIIILHERVNPDKGKRLRKGNDNFGGLRKMKNTPLRDVILRVETKYVFMGHEHNIYLEGKTGKTRLYGLMKVTEKSNLDSHYCYKVVSIETRI